MSVRVRRVQVEHAEEWQRMRTALWPDSPEDHEPEIREFLSGSGPIEAVFVAIRANGKLGGFAEAGSRPFAEGCVTRPVAYLEGLYVDPDLRGQGTARHLVAAVEAWARDQGFQELASDTDVANTASQATHRALGFDEAERVVCYRKAL